ncbi:20240_t:CDS:1, partial [Funneliformis geosporum]
NVQDNLRYKDSEIWTFGILGFGILLHSGYQNLGNWIFWKMDVSCISENWIPGNWHS